MPPVSRLTQTFQDLRSRNESALVVFITAGDPSIEGAAELALALADAGADIIELGIPYSDPLADGPVIQASSQRALDRGMTPPHVVNIVREIRARSQVPLILMTSYNLVLQCGLSEFARDCAEAGADGMILTDLPPEESLPWREAAAQYSLAPIFLVAPTSTSNRMQAIAQNAAGFVYCVSRTGVTGGGLELSDEVESFLRRMRAFTDLPLCLGFGISTPEQVRKAARFADGVVIGSALVEFLHHASLKGTLMTDVAPLVQSWKAATRREEPEA